MFKFFLSSIIISLIFILALLLAISFLTLWERKLLAAIQRRHGPVFTGFIGILQPFADGLKLLFQTFNIPSGVSYYIFIGSSVFSLVLSLLPWSILPFSKYFVIADVNCGLLVILLISSLNRCTLVFSGWSSNSKYGLLGSIRAGAQMASYEIPMLLSVLPILFLSSNLNLINIVIKQEFSFWYVFLFPNAFIFFVCMLAESNRPPFDLPEAESELVAGYNIEYSSMSFAVFFLAEYNHLITSSFLFSILFLGGWNLYPVYVESIELSGSWMTFILIMKAICIINLFIFVRAVLPRYRFTDLITMCWHVFIPVAICLFLFFWLIAYYNFIFKNTLLTSIVLLVTFDIVSAGVYYLFNRDDENKTAVEYQIMLLSKWLSKF